MKKLFFLVLIVSLLCTGCEVLPDTEFSESSDAENSYVFKPDTSSFGVAYASNASCNPYTTQNKLNIELAGLLCEGLFSVNEDFSVTPVLCSEYSYNNGVYSFKLKDGVTFSDGSPLTAQDVEYSLNAARAYGSYYATRLSSVSRISTVGDNQINIALSRENGRFPALLDIPIVKKGSLENGLAVGTGLYAPSMDRKSLVVRRNYHSKKDPVYSSLSLIDIRSTDELLFEYESGRVSILTIDPTGINTLSVDGVNDTHSISTLNMHYLGFNTADSALSNPAVRRMISRAIDRDSAAIQDFALMGVPAAMPIHPRSAMYPKEQATTLEYSPKAELQISKPLSILVNSESSAKLAVCNRIAASLSSIGIATTVRALPFNEYASALSRGDFTLYYAEVSLGADFDITRLISGPLNYGKFYDEALLSLNSAQLRAGEAESDFYFKFAELCPFAPIMFKDTALITQRGFFSTIHSTCQNTYNMFDTWTLGG